MNSINIEILEDIKPANNDGYKPFNVAYFKKYDETVTLASIINLASTKKSNFFMYTQYFTSLNFTSLINGITTEIFSLLEFLPDALNDIQYINVVNEETFISSNTQIDNLIVPDTVNTNAIVTNQITTPNIFVENIKCSNISSQQLKVKGCIYNPILGAINSLPIISGLYLFSDLHLTSSTYLLTLLPGYSFKVYNSDGILVYKVNNDSEKVIYNLDIQFNENYYSFKV